MAAVREMGLGGSGDEQARGLGGGWGCVQGVQAMQNRARRCV